MKKYLLALMLFFVPFLASANNDEQQIKDSLNKFVVSWNKGDINAAMDIYNNSPASLLISDKVIKGYDGIVKFWKDGYPNKEDMGKMVFSDVEVKLLSDKYAMAIGKWSLHSAKTSTGGIFTVLFEKTGQGWKSVIDHTTGL